MTDDIRTWTVYVPDLSPNSPRSFTVVEGKTFATRWRERQYFVQAADMESARAAAADLLAEDSYYRTRSR